MKNFIKNLQNTNALYSLWKRGDTIIVGVSGGRDSMCLAHTLHKIAHKEDLKIIVAHVNYGLRGESSDRDQAIVEKFCSHNDIICETLDVRTNEQGSNEAAWRATRRSFFARVATDYHANSIALGHHKDDHAETLLLHLFRGSGLQGLSNMTFYSQQILSSDINIPIQNSHTVIRPLLNVRRTDISIYCHDNSIEYGEDQTNTDVSFIRNRIRHELIPYLRENYTEDIVNILARSAHIVSDDYKYLQEIVSFSTVHRGDTVKFSANKFLTLSSSAQRYFLRKALRELTGDDSHGGFGLIEELRKALRSTKNKHRTIQTKDLIFSIKNATVEITLSH